MLRTSHTDVHHPLGFFVSILLYTYLRIGIDSLSLVLLLNSRLYSSNILSGVLSRHQAVTSILLFHPEL
jgi:hypothetical protein